MKLQHARRILALSSQALLCLWAALSSVSCESIYDSEGDCSVTYQVAFTQTRNMVGADAFSVRVKSLSLFLFTPDGKFVTSKTESGDKLAAKNYAMEFTDEELKPGTYDVIAWAGLSDNATWSLAGGSNPASKEDLVCRMEREQSESQKELTDLFHGAGRIEVPGNVYGTYRIEKNIDLTKNNNKLRIILQHYNGREMDKNDFHFIVRDDNGTMNYDNTLLADETITYREHYKESALVTTPTESRAGEGEITSITSVVAEIDVARLMADKRPMLIVEVDGKNKPVLNLPLIDLLLNAKGGYEPQEFLDRQDEYSLIFYLDDGYGWYTDGGIWVNSWHVVFNDSKI